MEYAADSAAPAAAGRGAKVRSAESARRSRLMSTTALTAVALAGLVIAAPLAVIGEARAQQYWDGEQTAPPANDADNTVDGGTGTWDLTNQEWTDAAGANPAPWAEGGAAVFQGVPGTVTIVTDAADDSRNVSGVTFDVSGYTIAGTAAANELVLTNGGADVTINVVTAGDTATISAVISSATTEGLEKLATARSYCRAPTPIPATPRSRPAA